ncbi:MAG: SHD1 domain-containing protein [Verrucomicrobiales bacterium]
MAKNFIFSNEPYLIDERTLLLRVQLQLINGIGFDRFHKARKYGFDMRSNGYKNGGVFAVVLLGLINLTVMAEMRVWTNSAGKKIKAEFVSSADGNVSIRIKNGKVFEVAIDQFSEADQKYTKAAAEKAANRGPQSSSRDVINGMAIAAEKEGKRPALEESIFISVDRSVPAQLSLKAEVLGFETKSTGTEGGGKRGFLRQTVKFP